ncbi:glutathione S-transferase theta-1 isoform X1 [Parasteatoda tepidariorum]|uniref:glutathione S-transferase theta-1 isoform X1 n=1 Tax=Parasteatoda tepidariorum TaxID=114398 RepID=UPI001C724F60|nr:glutathione S-transferase theta-1 isoform X1 [Parasteatoda tepidariorum]
MTLKVFYDLMSQPCRALIIFLKVNNISFESKVVALRKGEHLTEAFSKINPFRKVPVIDHNGFVLTESISMIRYLSREYKILDNWYPKDSKRQAKVDEYLEWQHLNTRLFGSMIFRERVITPLMTQKPINEEKIKFYKDGFQNVLKDIERGFLQNKNYLCGETISVADIFCACEIEQALAVGFDPFAEAPLVKAWLERIRQELDPHYSEVHGIVKKLASNIVSGKL